MPMVFRRSRDEAEQLFAKNLSLCHFFSQRWKASFPPGEYQEIMQEAYIGLWKAAQTYDESKGVNFGSYASRCIKNQIGMYYRHYGTTKTKPVMYLQEPISVGPDGNEHFLEDLLYSEHESDIDRKSVCSSLLKMATSKNEKVYLLNEFFGVRQRELAEALSLSQSYISRLATRGKRELRMKLGRGVS